MAKQVKQKANKPSSKHVMSGTYITTGVIKFRLAEQLMDANNLLRR